MVGVLSMRDIVRCWVQDGATSRAAGATGWRLAGSCSSGSSAMSRRVSRIQQPERDQHDHDADHRSCAGKITTPVMASVRPKASTTGWNDGPGRWMASPGVGRGVGRRGPRRPSVDEPHDPAEREDDQRDRAGDQAGAEVLVGEPPVHGSVVLARRGVGSQEPSAGPDSPARRRSEEPRPGRNSASTEPPKPPPMMRAPSAPAALQASTGALDLGRGHLVVVAQAARGRHRAARPARRGRRSSAATAASTRSFSVITWRTRRSSGSRAAPGSVASRSESTPSSSAAPRHSSRRSL